MNGQARNVAAMRANGTTGLLLLIRCICSAGCVHYSATANRNASFVPNGAAKVGKVGFRGFLIARSAVLLKAEQLSITHSGPTSRTYSIAGMVSWLENAAAIDHRGYSLTGAHCLENAPLWLMFFNENPASAPFADMPGAYPTWFTLMNSV